MAKELRCRDLGFDCDAVVTGENEDEIVAQVVEHARAVHGMTDEQLADPALQQQVHDRIHEAPAPA